MNNDFDDLLKGLPGKRVHDDMFIRYEYGDVDGRAIYVMRRKMGQHIGNLIADSAEFFKSAEVRSGIYAIGAAIELDAVILTSEEHHRSIVEAYKKGFSDGMRRSSMEMLVSNALANGGGETP